MRHHELLTKLDSVPLGLRSSRCGRRLQWPEAKANAL
jgi:hypothetical protein